MGVASNNQTWLVDVPSEPPCIVDFQWPCLLEGMGFSWDIYGMFKWFSNQTVRIV